MIEHATTSSVLITLHSHFVVILPYLIQLWWLIQSFKISLSITVSYNSVGTKRLKWNDRNMSVCYLKLYFRVVFVVPVSSARVPNLKRLHRRPAVANVCTICTAAFQHNPASPYGSCGNLGMESQASQRIRCVSMAPSDSSNRYWKISLFSYSVLPHVRRF